MGNTDHAAPFLARLWGDQYPSAFICGKTNGVWSDTRIESDDEALREIDRRVALGGDVYMSCAVFSNVHGRKAENATSARAFWLDLDCGTGKAADGKGYASKKDAKNDLIKFSKKIGVPAPTIIDSGNGLHVYWHLDRAVPAAVWKAVAHKLKLLTRKHRLLADDSCTADLARVLRVPGTYNHKDPANPKLVKIKYIAESISAIFFAAAIEKACSNIEQDGQQTTAPLPAYMTDHSGNLGAMVTPETPEALHRLQDALSSIPADCDRDTWRSVVWAVLAHGWACCEDVAREWSAHSTEKFNEADFGSVVSSFDPQGGTGAGTLYHVAKQHGWNDVAKPQGTAEALATSEPGDMQAARVFARLNEGRLSYVAQVGRWMLWDGIRWGWCGTGEEMQAAKRTADAVLDHCIKLVRQDAERHKKRLAFALRLQNLPRLEAMLRLAQSEPGMSVGTMTELDADPWLLGVKNGVVDLKTGAFLAPDPKMLITRQAGALYDRGAKCPRWLEFLHSIMEGDVDTIGFIRRALGYTLTGLTTEEMLFICYGFGANGKSVFSNVISRILGDYSQMAPPSLLTVRRDGDSGPRNDIARLCGARGLQINELQQGDRLDEQVVKMLAGREQLSARFLHREFFDFWPTAKPWLRTNHRPIVTGDDDGIWRRIALIPFKLKVAESERNPWLEQQLMEESAGILAWMVEGCLEWQRVGLSPSALVRNESASYRTESDLLGEFLQDEAISEPSERTMQSVAFDRWRVWCERGALRSGTKASFTRKLSERGFKESKSNGQRYYAGLKLRGAAPG